MIDQSETHGRILVKLDDAGAVHIERRTAESAIVMRIRAANQGGATCAFAVADSIDVTSFPALLGAFCEAAGISMSLEFSATRLTSSHVVLEDTGLALGMGLFEMLRDRMMAHGVNGAGSSLKTKDDFLHAGVSASISVEGRKFLKIQDVHGDGSFRWRHALGKSAFGTVRSEDIDDFIDALAGGMKASFFLHERRAYTDSAVFWEDAITALGLAMREAFEPNPARKGLPPGVKATLL